MKTLLKSILTGAGFAIGLLLVFFMWGQINKALPANRNAPYHEREESIVGKNYALIINERFQNETDTTVIGTVSNTTGQTLDNVIVEASLFDEFGAFLTKENEFVDAINPHGTFNFQISFPMPYNRRGSYQKNQNDETVWVEKACSMETKIRQGHLIPFSRASDKPSNVIENHPAAKHIDPLTEFSVQLKKYAPALVVTEMIHSENGALIFKLKGDACFADGASIVIPEPETKDLGEVARRLKMIIDLSGDRKSAPIKELKVTSENNIGVVYADSHPLHGESAAAPQESQPETRIHIVYPGETFDDIARHYGVPAEDIKIVNGISEGEPVKVGSKLIIPQ